MMSAKISYWFLVLNLFFLAMTDAQKTADRPISSKTYQVKKVDNQNFEYMDDPTMAWSLANVLSDFSYPWRKDNPHMTVFRALYNDTYLYFRYDAVDPEIHINRETGQKTDVIDSDRVEIFFLANKSMNPYYCLEIDAEGKLFDYQANYYRKNNLAWSWPKAHLELKPFKKKNGYGICGKVSLEYLRELGILEKNSLDVGLFRADVSGKNENGPIFKWISWVHPDAKEPDFHIPSAFGKFILLE